jgi:transcriptional regulator GlxA family with amidase domain
VHAVVDVMKKNLHHPLEVAELADAVHLSPTHLRRLFKKETGTSLGRYLRQLRLQQAKQLLATTYLSVKEVASRVGISGVSHFVRDFQTEQGIPPAKYRARHRRARQLSLRHPPDKAQIG